MTDQPLDADEAFAPATAQSLKAVVRDAAYWPRPPAMKAAIVGNAVV